MSGDSARREIKTDNDLRLELQADCERCFGLCCAALPFAASIDFAIDKDAGQPCPNLRDDFRCGIHSQLRDRGFRGCTVYDCFGAGQKVSQVTYNGNDWRQASPDTARTMFEVFPVMRQLQELLWYLDEALNLQAARPIHEAIGITLHETEHLTLLAPEALLELDVAAHRAEVNHLLLQTSRLVRGEALRMFPDMPKRRKRYDRGADLVGAKLRGTDLRCANLRGALLIVADLRGADLRAADLIGADMRDTDLSGADLTGAIFLTQSQLNSAKGDAHTLLPPSLSRPAHWYATSITNSKEVE